MNISRLMILGLLAGGGPMHGHQIRRTAELTNAETWGGITGGALYSELRKLASEDLIRAVREEQVGRRPARTIYAITEEGRLELFVQREAALNVVFGAADPVSVVILFAAGSDLRELTGWLMARRRRVAAQLETIAEERSRLTTLGVLPPLAIAAFRRGELKLDAELRWHEEFEAQMTELAPASAEPSPVPGGFPDPLRRDLPGPGKGRAAAPERRV